MLFKYSLSSQCSWCCVILPIPTKPSNIWAFHLSQLWSITLICKKKLAKVDDQTFPQNIFLIFKACHYPKISVPTSQEKKTSTNHHHHIFHHQAGRDEEKLVIWDYHVIALYRPEEVPHHHLHHLHHHHCHHHCHHHGQHMKTHVWPTGSDVSVRPWQWTALPNLLS